MIPEDLRHWTPVPHPQPVAHHGSGVRLEPLSRDVHAAALFRAFSEDLEGALWEYLPYGPFPSAEAFAEFVHTSSLGRDPLFFAILDTESGEALGFAAYLRLDPTNGVIEIGHLAFSPRLQRTRQATEAFYLLLRHARDLGYRRIEWKCNDRNLPSRRAAERLGFTYEGTFRQAAVIKGRNRDTAWYSILDKEAGRILSALEAWLAPRNFDTDGRQILSLMTIRETLT